MEITLKGFESCRVLSAAVLAAMGHISGMEIELSGKRLQVWVENRTTGRRYLCAEGVTPGSIQVTSETSGHHAE